MRQNPCMGEWREGLSAVLGAEGRESGDRTDRCERLRCSYFSPVGQRRLSSSNQFWTRVSSVTGWGFTFCGFTLRNF